MQQLSVSDVFHRLRVLARMPGERELDLFDVGWCSRVVGCVQVGMSADCWLCVACNKLGVGDMLEISSGRLLWLCCANEWERLVTFRDGYARATIVSPGENYSRTMRVSESESESRLELDCGLTEVGWR
jgi:hypothetical protein